MSLTQPTKITDNFQKNALARAVPYSYFGDGAWWLPPDPDPESARVALKLFPGLAATQPELLAAARLSACDFTPIDLATEWWNGLDEDEREEWRADRTQAAALKYVNRKGEHTPMTPHEFQIMDAAYATQRLGEGKGAYLGWEMGLGKTFGACLVMDMWDVNFAFIACPNSAKHDPWAHDLPQLCPWMKTLVVGNTPKDRARALDEAKERMDAGEPTALVCHYEAVRLIEGDNKLGWLKFGRWDIKVADEAHLFKNRTAKFTASMRRLDAVGMLDLSGSVMSGAAEDLFVPWQMFRPKTFRSQWRDWNDKYLETFNDDYGRKHITGPMMHRLPEFREMLGEVLVVRKAKDWLEIPEPHIIDRTDLVMYPEQARVYREIADELMAELPDGEIMYSTDGAPLRSALRRITAGVPERCDCLGLPSPGFTCKQCDGTGSVGLLSIKHDAAMEDILAAGDSQLVMFGWHRATVEELRRRCAAAGVGCGVVSGAYSQRTRDETIDLFKRGGYHVLAATIATLSMAANLQNASIVGLIEESDDPVANEQAVGRVVRQGQLAKASVIRYRVKDSVDDLSVATNALTKAELRRLILGA